jgi:hypothetical protein
MLKKFLIFIPLSFAVQFLFGQENLKVIKASNLMVDIREGETFKKADWRISPKAKPDIYITSANGKKVTFYTDQDSISCIVKPGLKFRFIILLNNTDSALTEINYMPTFREILKRADKYNNNDKREIPAFSYQSADNPNLVALRKQYKLDSIAGSGNEISRMLNLMHWLHNLIRHDNGPTPKLMNAASMLQLCKSEKRGLNCRQLATILNECYLSLGFKSKYVQCSPKDSLGTDNDCHVINSVYSMSMNKWIWIDPTFDAYVMNEKGELLGIEEVRERIIRNMPLILNPDANWNHITSRTKEDYLYEYMAKNLYRLECPVSSEYNLETMENGKIIKYVSLLPFDNYKQTPSVVFVNWGNGTSSFTYKTNNPEVFWKAP